MSAATGTEAGAAAPTGVHRLLRAGVGDDPDELVLVRVGEADGHDVGGTVRPQGRHRGQVALGQEDQRLRG